jgi:hypothetical protein
MLTTCQHLCFGFKFRLCLVTNNLMSFAYIKISGINSFQKILAFPPSESAKLIYTLIHDETCLFL